MSVRRENGVDATKSSLLQGRLLLGFLLAFLLCVFISTFHFLPRFLRQTAANPASFTAPLFTTTVIITGVAFVLTQVPLFYFSFRFKTSTTTEATFIKGSNWLEVVWTVVPAIAFIFLFAWGEKVWSKVTDAPAVDALEIEVMAEQFDWKVRYAGNDGKMGRSDFRFISDINDMGIDHTDSAAQDDFIPLQMHVPKNKTINLTLRSKDVIHSFYVPTFGIKMDAVPGMSTALHFTPLYTTDEMRRKLSDPHFNYEVACAELCGRMHFTMKLIIVVDEPSDFLRWYSIQKKWTTERRGQKVQ